MSTRRFVLAVVVPIVLLVATVVALWVQEVLL